MERTRDLRRGADTQRAGDAELEAPVGPHMGPVPVAALDEALPLEMPSLHASAEPGTPDSTLARCQVRTWSLDPRTMISFAGPQPAQGAEEFRALRSRLYGLREKRPMKSLLVTSALPQEGRTYVAANLANVLALQPQCRVLLIDADLRSPRLHSVLGSSSTPGLSEYLLQEAEESHIVQRGTVEGLFFIPSGRSVSGPTELLGTGRLESLIELYETVFDWIVVDSPATIPVSDAGLIANACDGVLLVVRSHSTPFDIVQRARQRFREDSLAGVVLNGIEAESSPRSRY